MKKIYDEPKLETINFNVEENLMDISPRLGGVDGSGLEGEESSEGSTDSYRF